MNLVRGTRLVVGSGRREAINTLSKIAESRGFRPVDLPSVEFSDLYSQEIGPEVLGQMYVFPDRKGRSLCLRPECTQTLRGWARDNPNAIDTRLYYAEKCWRYERPQAGRYREFTQFGVEWLWPSDRGAALEEIAALACRMATDFAPDYRFHQNVRRGLSYYVGDGFEVSCERLGAQKQICGGGAYPEGGGFAFGVERLMLCKGVEAI